MGLFSWLFKPKETKERKQYQTALNNQLNSTTQGFNEYTDLIKGRLADANVRDQQSAGDITKGYWDAYGAPSSSRGYFEDLASTGGLDPNDVGRVQANADEALRYGRNPINAADKARLRGGGVYDEFAKTGGWTDADVANVRARMASDTPSFYNSLRDRLTTQNSVTGSSNPGFGASLRALAREQARSSADAIRNGEIGLHDSITSGQRWGAEGMTSSESALQQLLQSAMFQGLNTAGGLNSKIMDARQQGRISGAQGLNQADSLESNNRFNALSGLSNLRNAPGEADRLLQYYLSALGQGASSTGGLINSGLAANPVQNSPFQNILGVAGAAAPFISAFAGGGGGGGPVSNLPLSNTQGYTSYNPNNRLGVR